MPASPSHHTGIYWIRRDLRVADNRVLLAAAQAGELVCPVFVVSTWQRTHPWTGPNRQQFLCDSLAELSENLAALGGRLLIRRGDQFSYFRPGRESCQSHHHQGG